MSTASPVLASDAAIALGIASTAMPFARTRDAALERWLRILRLYGEAGAALQALGVGEGRLPESGEQDAHAGARTAPVPMDEDSAERVGELACEIAHEMHDEPITTKHLLLALMRLYGAEFDRVLAAHGAQRADLMQRLG
jgi:hypothetical protein